MKKDIQLVVQAARSAALAVQIKFPAKDYKSARACECSEQCSEVFACAESVSDSCNRSPEAVSVKEGRSFWVDLKEE